MAATKWIKDVVSEEEPRKKLEKQLGNQGRLSGVGSRQVGRTAELDARKASAMTVASQLA